jgi:hypothetical protein
MLSFSCLTNGATVFLLFEAVKVYFPPITVKEKVKIFCVGHKEQVLSTAYRSEKLTKQPFLLLSSGKESRQRFLGRSN